MPQRLIQSQEQRLQQQQRLSQQQMLQVRLLEMPLTELEESVMTELDDNPALEAAPVDDALGDLREETGDDPTDADFDQQQEREEREDALENALEGIGRDDEMPQAYGEHTVQNADYEEMVYGDTVSFYDKLKEQMGELDLSEQDRQVMEYLIGSLDDDGLLRKDLDTISDELAVYYSLDLTAAEVERVLRLLQTFDPAGIGARSLQECLLLQVERKARAQAQAAQSPGRNGSQEPAAALSHSLLYSQLKELLTHHFDAFTKKHWSRIQQQMQLSDSQMEALQAEIRHLNPKPGASLGETVGRNLQQITPDFIVETHEDGRVTFYLNHGHVPELKVSPSFTDMVEAYKNNRDGLSRQTKEALLYAKQKVDKAQGFIEAVRQRRHTLRLTMQAIIDWQLRFFQDGDEADLRPMILKDIADRTGLDISTVSRVSNVKYAQTKWGTFPLRFFFSDGYTTAEGNELSTRKMKIALREIISEEDKRRPLSDDALTAVMKEKGFPIARRTVAKYREQLGIPVARLRKE